LKLGAVTPGDMLQGGNAGSFLLAVTAVLIPLLTTFKLSYDAYNIYVKLMAKYKKARAERKSKKAIK